MSPRRPNLSPLYHMPRKMKQDYFVVYSRILIGWLRRFPGAPVCWFLDCAGGARCGRLRAKRKYFIKMPVKFGNHCKKNRRKLTKLRAKKQKLFKMPVKFGNKCKNLRNITGKINTKYKNARKKVKYWKSCRGAAQKRVTGGRMQDSVIYAKSFS